MLEHENNVKYSKTKLNKGQTYNNLSTILSDSSNGVEKLYLYNIKK